MPDSSAVQSHSCNSNLPVVTPAAVRCLASASAALLRSICARPAQGQQQLRANDRIPASTPPRTTGSDGRDPLLQIEVLQHRARRVN